MAGFSIKVVQLTDIHMCADKETELLGVKTYESFNAVISLLKNDAIKPDLFILSGDLSQDGSEASYVRLADTFKQFNVPVSYVPGNHDNLDAMTKVFPLENITSHKHFLLGPWQFILLNSQKDNSVEGFLDRSQLNYLQNCLQMYADKYAFVVLHHPPVAIGSAWMDKIALSNAKEFWQIVKYYPKLKGLMFGHAHQEFAKKVKGVQCFCSPSTCIQFKSNQADFSLVQLPPGYRSFEFYANGKMQTRVHRCAQYVGKFEEKAQGY